MTTTATISIPRDLRGGDHWYAARPQTVCFRAAAVVHRRGGAGSHDVAAACGIPVAKAYEALVACCRRPHLYHVVRGARGRFVPLAPHRADHGANNRTITSDPSPERA
jgi:hypothetical protein